MTKEDIKAAIVKATPYKPISASKVLMRAANVTHAHFIPSQFISAFWELIDNKCIELDKTLGVKKSKYRSIKRQHEDTT